MNKEVFIVYCWLKHSVTIVGAANTQKGAELLREQYINSAPDKNWEIVSRERNNNTIVQKTLLIVDNNLSWICNDLL